MKKKEAYYLTISSAECLLVNERITKKMYSSILKHVEEEINLTQVDESELVDFHRQEKIFYFYSFDMDTIEYKIGSAYMLLRKYQFHK